jgi:hypothetical protein
MAAARRICVIGNSSVGAVRAALADRGAAERYDLSFFASGGDKYDKIRLDGDRLAGAEIDSGGDSILAGYDAFALHGRFPAGFEALIFARGLAAARYSRAVRAAALRDWRDHYKSWGLGLALHARFGKPVLALSRNVFASERAGARLERAQGDEVMAGLIAPLRFVPLPDALFEEDGQVRRPFYSRYINVRGRESAAGGLDEWHYNREAGGLILDGLLRALDAALTP